MSNWLGVAVDPQGVPGPAGAERLLSDAVRRATMPGLAPPGLAALAVRLAAVPPPGPRPQHRRVVRAMLDEAALHHGGQVFALGNGDLVLLAPAAALREAGRGDTLPETLGRLLGDVGTGLITVWRLPAERERLVAYAADRLAEGRRLPTDPLLAGRERPREAADPPLLPALLHRQTAVLLGGGGRLLQPLFREIGASETALKAQPGAEALEPDPYLLRHLARQMEALLLGVLPGELGRRGALDAAAGPRLHLNLSPEGVMSEGFAAFAEHLLLYGRHQLADLPDETIHRDRERLAARLGDELVRVPDELLIMGDLHRCYSFRLRVFFPRNCQCAGSSTFPRADVPSIQATISCFCGSVNL